MKDEIFSEKQSVADFEFSAKVASVFDDMLDRSVPFYQEMQRMIAELAADGVHDIVRSRAARLVNEDGAVQRGEFLHGNYFAPLIAFLTAATTRRCTESGRPGIRAPAAPPAAG